MTKRPKKKFCGSKTLIGHEWINGADFYHYHRLGCNNWSCPECAAKKSKRLAKSLRSEAQRKGLDRLLTLTIDPKKVSCEDSYGEIKRIWADFRVYLRRKFGLTVDFVWVVELQKNGYAHLHVLVNRYIDQRWISNAWSKLGGGRIVDIRRAEIGRVIRYVSKYLVKNLEGRFEKGKRRYTSSRSVVLRVAKSEGIDWKLSNTGLEYLKDTSGAKILGEFSDSAGKIYGFFTDTPIFDHEQPPGGRNGKNCD